MNCKHCGAPMNEGDTVCSACQKPAEQDVEAVETAAAVETPEAVKVEEPTAPAAEEKKTNSTKLVVGIVAILVVIAVAVALLFTGKNKPADSADASDAEAVTEESATEETSEDASAETESTEETTFVAPVSYVYDEEAFTDELVNTVIANCGDSELTNQKLAYYYWREYYNLASSYSYYIYYVMDPASPLDTQAYSEDTSWDMLFMDYALDSYHTLAAAATKAAAEGYELTDDDQAVLDGLEEELNTYAVNNGLADADAYLQSCFGPYCDLESYTAFMEEYMLGASYLNAQLEATEITDEDLVSYYEENQEDYDANGITKDDTSMINVRHILIMPETVEIAEGEEGYEEAVQTANDNAKTKAEEIYAEWQNGEQTEESFAALATEYTEDTGSMSTGGLYENVYPGQMVTSFNDWCFDEARVEGDTAIVETDYGYHIMYFVGETGESYWHSVVYADYQTMIYSKLCQDCQQEYALESDLSKAAVYACNVS